MWKTLVLALMMSGCVFGAETDSVSVDATTVRLLSASAMTDTGMQPMRDVFFLPDFETAHNELSFRGDGWLGTINFEDVLEVATSGGPESIVIERDGGRAEVQPIQIQSEMSPNSVAWQHSTMTFVTYIDNRAVQIELEMEIQAYDPC